MNLTFGSTPDNRLISLFQNGNELAFKSIFEKYNVKILHYINSMVNDTTLAQDLSQDSFIKLAVKLRKGDSEIHELRSYLFEIAKNVTFNHFRQQKQTWKNVPLLELQEISITENPLSLFEIKEKEILYKKARKTLTDDQKLLFDLRLHQYNYAYIEKFMGVARETLRGRMKKIIVAMNEEVGKY